MNGGTDPERDAAMTWDETWDVVVNFLNLEGCRAANDKMNGGRRKCGRPARRAAKWIWK